MLCIPIGVIAQHRLMMMRIIILKFTPAYYEHNK